MSALIVALNEPVSSMPSRLTVLKPVSVNVTEYVPGRRSTMRYVPVPSLTADRVFSISAGLEASTVTPGRTAPDASFTTPVMEAWANATAGTSTSGASAANPTCNLGMHYLPSFDNPKENGEQALRAAAGEIRRYSRGGVN